jgi:hypothetical protein
VLVRLLSDADAIPPALADLPRVPAPDADAATKELALMWMLVQHARDAQKHDPPDFVMSMTFYYPMRPYLELTIVGNKDWPVESKESFDAVYGHEYLAEFEKHNQIRFYMELPLFRYLNYSELPMACQFAYSKDSEEHLDYLLEMLILDRVPREEGHGPVLEKNLHLLTVLREVLSNKQNAERFLAKVIRFEKLRWLVWYETGLKNKEVPDCADTLAVLDRVGQRGTRYSRRFIEQVERLFGAKLFDEVILGY